MIPRILILKNLYFVDFPLIAVVNYGTKKKNNRTYMNIVIWKEYITAILSYILLNLKPSLEFLEVLLLVASICFVTNKYTYLVLPLRLSYIA